jgi:hypothetical protein
MNEEKKEPKKIVKAKLIGTVLDIGISLLLGAIIIGKVSLPTFYAVVTTTFDPYTLLVWGIIPLVGVAAWMTATYNRAKYAYTMGGQGGLG